ncbi:Vps62-related protein [Hyalangium gracile]|uniref:Vps62-related protein n=1 Tax=Hyalangium gracile TaxID=394092 RepID=UPI001CD00030|nr:Vps62-related protein [Hyalangium gracile]
MPEGDEPATGEVRQASTSAVLGTAACNDRVLLKSWKGDYLHRPDSPQGVTTWGNISGSIWTVECMANGKLQLRSWKGDYLHRPDSPQGVTTWGFGEWTAENAQGGKVRLRSWKGDYLHRPDSPQGVTTWSSGDWTVEPDPSQRPPSSGGNTLYGHWQGSGGQNPYSTGNRVFLLDHTGVAETQTFTLTSSADSYLYLLDASGNVLAQDDNGGGGGHARLSLTLSPGSYKLVAATTTAGQSAEFLLSSDKARLRYSQRLELQPSSRFHWIYDDSGSGADNDVSVWRPDLSQTPGFYSLGDVAMGSHGRAPGMTFVVRGEGDVLARPLDYNWIWSDWGSGGTHDGSFWEPVAPAGYTCLGAVAALGYSKPSTDLIRCVKNEYVLPAVPSWVWNDSGSGADHDVSLWQAAPQDHRSLSPSTFVARPNHGDTGGNRYWALNKSATANEHLRGGAVDTWAVTAFAPRVWLAPDEYYWPSSTQFHLANVHEENGHLVTNQPLGCDSCTDPQFLDGQRPDQTSVPVYAQIIRRTQGGQPTNVTDILYWTFYPYNNGKRVCIGWYSPWGCVGGYSTFGNHVGDWEHLTVRFIDGRPAQVYLSQHANGQTFTFGDKGMLFTGWHPEVFAAHGSHGLYPDAARHIYETIFNGDFLADDTGYGLAWNTWDNVVAIPWQPLGSYTGSLAWLNITAAWGNPASGCDNPTGYCVNSGGPGALMTRSVSNPEFMTLE